ncbi:hypothetical protein Mbo2_087 [Rhodococcus phage Mbo2]|uniref:Uncharacterized protein n=1 Tax=Rhodococcus phage Mbo2 TaxID=2936911 RepID=A0A9E7L9Y3_9CAUD|nr:hypothetical protein Mbo2_087 [Rhodococcus phage Mbo2]
MSCTIPGCEKPHRARGYCQMHYKRLRKYGDPLTEPPTQRGVRKSAAWYAAREETVRRQREAFLAEYEEYRSAGLSVDQIAHEFGVQRDSLILRLRRIERRLEQVA